ncbi:MAG TPA: hypothetical protein VIF62_08595 [Labilithrix sp.]|jgi:hypothetical protein
MAGAPPDAGDAAGPDAPDASDGDDDDQTADGAVGVDGGPLVSNGGFEVPGEVGCGPAWSGLSASLTRVGSGRSGMYACRVCQNGTTIGQFGIFQSISLDVGTYALQAWARDAQDGGGTPPDGGVALSLIYALPDGGRRAMTTTAALTPMYMPVQVGATAIPPDAAPYSVKMTSRYAADVGDCFVVDDFVLVAE